MFKRKHLNVQRADGRRSTTPGIHGKAMFHKVGKQEEELKTTKHLCLRIEITARTMTIFGGRGMVKNTYISIGVSNILPHHGPAKECTLLYILSLTHLISSQVIRFAIASVEATVTSDPLGPTLSSEDPCGARDKNVC